ncbi:MAG: hypothetical protein Fur0032_08370 [Terrimicrobiaceae bacterium]
MLPWFLATAAFVTASLPLIAQTEQELLEQELVASSDQHMRDELGVNDITTPSIASILKDLDSFRPVPIATISANKRDAVFESRMQTAIHLGSLVADGFMLTIAERPQDLEEIGKALIRQSRALGVGDRLTKRSKSLLELSSQGDWIGMRAELIQTQSDVEQAMMDLRDEEMAHMISLGGWLRGFQLAAISTNENYSAERAAILGRTEIMDYFLDRLDTLHPRLKATEFATRLTSSLREIRMVAIETQGNPPTPEQVASMARLATDAMSVALGPVDTEGNILPSTPQP